MLQRLAENFFNKHAGETLTYHGGDNPIQNLKNRQKINLVDRNKTPNFDAHEVWDSVIPEDEVLYKISSLGNRCDEFRETSLSVLFMGCSDTWGLGLPLNKIWSYRLYEKIKDHSGLFDIPYYNISRVGTSLGGQYWLLNRWYDLFKPQYIFLLIPNPYRKLIYFENQLEEFRLMPPMVDRYSLAKYKMLFTDESFMLQNMETYLHLINFYCKEKNIKVFCMSSWGYLNTENDILINDILPQLNNLIYLKDVTPCMWDVARDRAHWGEYTNQLFSEKLFEHVCIEFTRDKWNHLIKHSV